MPEPYQARFVPALCVNSLPLLRCTGNQATVLPEENWKETLVWNEFQRGFSI